MKARYKSWCSWVRWLVWVDPSYWTGASLIQNVERHTAGHCPDNLRAAVLAYADFVAGRQIPF